MQLLLVDRYHFQVHCILLPIIHCHWYHTLLWCSPQVYLGIFGFDQSHRRFRMNQPLYHGLHPYHLQDHHILQPIPL